MRISILLYVCVCLAAGAARTPASAAGPGASAGPEAAVWEMFDRFEHRDVDGYVGAMAGDFAFDSDEPGFRAAFPAGMDRAAERAFVTHLFAGGARGPQGEPLPVAVRVVETVGPMRVTVEALDDSRARARIDRYGLELTFSDSSRAELGGSANDFELVLADGAWRIRRWHETLRPEPAVAAAARPREPRAEAAAGAREPLALSISARADRTEYGLRFDLVLPSAGGALELFDVMGRRIARRDLGGMPAGAHVVALEGGAIPAGEYWARVRQGGEAVSARLVWVP